MDVCSKCQKALNCSSKAIYCDICNNWLHLKCSNVSNIQFLSWLQAQHHTTAMLVYQTPCPLMQ